jgi:biotin/methionine sulfoxide reductase
MLPVPNAPIVSTHWGIFRAVHEGDRLVRLDPVEWDPAPAPFGRSMVDTVTSPARILRPMVRASFLAGGHSAGGDLRGREPFVAVSWPEAISIVARELSRVRSTFGNSAIYAGSYGWASAGRFHHAQSQLKRFLNLIGGFTRSVNSYSFGAAEVILPHVLGDHRGLLGEQTTWGAIAEHGDLVVAFGGISGKNSQINAGGVGRHSLAENLAHLRQSGIEVLSVSPIRDDTDPASGARWLPIRPSTDVALMLALAHVLIGEDRHDKAFLDRCTVGLPVFRAYVMGDGDGVPKTPEWASAITGVPAGTIRDLARRMAGGRTLVAVSWSLQRAEHGEQPYWMAIALAALLGQIGLPGGGFGFGYGAVNGVGNAVLPIRWPSLPQGRNPVEAFIPVARIADMLLHPGARYDYDGRSLTYPDIRLVYWAGGNPFHHHQDINRLVKAWRRPEVVVTHDSFWTATARHSDIVLPATLQLERNDISCSNRDSSIAGSHRVAASAGEARDDFAIFSDLARAFGVEAGFTEGRDEEAWLRHFYTLARAECAEHGVLLPGFDEFWREGFVALPEADDAPPLLAAFRADPAANALATPSGKIEIHSRTIADFGYADCPGHPVWLEPREWLGAPAAGRFRLHLLSNQPRTKLHSQLDHGIHSREDKAHAREPVRMHPHDAARRGISEGSVVRLYNDRGACLASVRFSEEIVPGVVQIATGAWYDPLVPGAPDSLDKHGNPNVLTSDRGTSMLAQGSTANSCLIEIEPYTDELPEITCFSAPKVLEQGALAAATTGASAEARSGPL